MAKTRGRPAKKAEEEEIDVAPVLTGPKTTLSAEERNPPQLFILPENLSTEARIVQLENPRHSTNSPYVVCPEKGFYELTKVAAPKTTPRSWLLTSGSEDSKEVQPSESKSNSDEKFSINGYVLRNANLLVATPIDTLFLALPALTVKSNSKGEEKRLFLTGDDYLDRIGEASPEIKPLLRNEAVKALIEKRIKAVCDTVDAGDETMYRISEEKLLAELLKKAKRMIKKGLTPSMEEKLVRKALEVPVPLIVVEETEEVTRSTETAVLTPQAETLDTQSTLVTTDSFASSFSEASTTVSSFSEEMTTFKKTVQIPAEPPIEAPEGVADLLRLRTALSFLCSKYLSTQLSHAIKTMASSPTCGIDFTPLDTHLAEIAKKRQEAFATRSLGDASRKRGLELDDEDGNGESRAEKKRRKEEEEKRKKAGESRGVKNLKKVNVSGMKKMSDFFKKKA